MAIITLTGVVLTAVLSYLAARNGRKAAKSSASVDDAVNHRHPDEPRLFDVVKEIRLNQDLFRDRIDVIDMKIDTMGMAFDLRLDKVQREARAAEAALGEEINRINVGE